MGELMRCGNIVDDQDKLNKQLSVTDSESCLWDIFDQSLIKFL